MGPEDLPLPTEFGPYQLLRLIGAGGMARVYQARLGGLHGFEKRLAIKMMLPEYAHDTEFVTMLIDEAKIAVALNHGNICQVHDLGCIDDRYYIAMEYVEGADLNKVVNRSLRKKVPIPFDVIAHIGHDICSGLGYAHAKVDGQDKPLNIIHRDISPANILLSMSGEVKIVDFGVAKAAHRSQNTSVGVVKGKYQYMSPEQVTGSKIDHRSDIFAAGIVLYETIAGRMMYPEGPDMLDRIRAAKMRPLRQVRPDVPRELDQIILKALSRNPDDRCQTAGEMGETLAEFQLVYQAKKGRGRLDDLMSRLFGEEIRKAGAEVAALAPLQADENVPDPYAPLEPTGEGADWLANDSAPPDSAAPNELEWDDEELETRASAGGPTNERVHKDFAWRADDEETMTARRRKSAAPPVLMPRFNDDPVTQRPIIDTSANQKADTSDLVDLTPDYLSADPEDEDSEEPTVAAASLSESIGLVEAAENTAEFTITDDPPQALQSAPTAETKPPLSKRPPRTDSTGRTTSDYELEVDIDTYLMDTAGKQPRSGYFLVQDPGGDTAGPFSRAELQDMLLDKKIGLDHLATPTSGATISTAPQGAQWSSPVLFVSDGDMDYEAQIGLQLPPSTQTFAIDVEPTARLFLQMAAKRRNGVVIFDRPGVHKEVTFAEGAPTYASSNITDEQVGSHLGQLGLLTDDELLAALRTALDQNEMLADAIVQHGFVSDDVVRSCVEQLIFTRLLELFRWTTGHMSIHPGQFDAAPIDFVVDPLELIKQGITHSAGDSGPGDWLRRQENRTLILSGESRKPLVVLGIPEDSLHFLDRFSVPMSVSEVIEAVIAERLDDEKIAAAILAAFQIGYLAAVAE